MYLRRENRRVNGLQGYNVNDHGKVACLFWECHVSSSTFQVYYTRNELSPH
jgi:hypothetical protein